MPLVPDSPLRLLVCFQVPAASPWAPGRKLSSERNHTDRLLPVERAWSPLPLRAPPSPTKGTEKADTSRGEAWAEEAGRGLNKHAQSEKFTASTWRGPNRDGRQLPPSVTANEPSGFVGILEKQTVMPHNCHCKLEGFIHSEEKNNNWLLLREIWIWPVFYWQSLSPSSQQFWEI